MCRMVALRGFPLWRGVRFGVLDDALQHDTLTGWPRLLRSAPGPLQGDMLHAGQCAAGTPLGGEFFPTENGVPPVESCRRATESSSCRAAPLRPAATTYSPGSRCPHQPAATPTGTAAAPVSSCVRTARVCADNVASISIGRRPCSPAAGLSDHTLPAASRPQGGTFSCRTTPASARPLGCPAWITTDERSSVATAPGNRSEVAQAVARSSTTVSASRRPADSGGARVLRPSGTDDGRAGRSPQCSSRVAGRSVLHWSACAACGAASVWCQSRSAGDRHGTATGGGEREHSDQRGQLLSARRRATESGIDASLTLPATAG